MKKSKRQNLTESKLLNKLIFTKHYKIRTHSDTTEKNQNEQRFLVQDVNEKHKSTMH